MNTAVKQFRTISSSKHCWNIQNTAVSFKVELHIIIIIRLLRFSPLHFCTLCPDFIKAWFTPYNCMYCWKMKEISNLMASACQGGGIWCYHRQRMKWSRQSVLDIVVKVPNYDWETVPWLLSSHTQSDNLSHSVVLRVKWGWRNGRSCFGFSLWEK